jgi:opacity protein-like surface antigen
MTSILTVRHAAALLPALLAAPLPALAADAVAPSADLAAGTNYVGLHLGRNNVSQLHARVDFGAGEPFAGDARAANGLHGGLVLGHRTEHARFELEYETGRFDVEHVTLGPQSAGVDARGEYGAVFANAYRTERLNESVDAFVGAGIGLGRVKLPRIGLGDTCACFGPASKSGAALQLRAGLDYRVSDASSIGLQYSWLRLPALEAGGPPSVRYDRKNVGAWSVAWTHRF